MLYCILKIASVNNSYFFLHLPIQVKHVKMFLVVTVCPWIGSFHFSDYAMERKTNHRLVGALSHVDAPRVLLKYIFLR